MAQLPKPYLDVLTKTDVIKCYGSIYKTTGGGMGSINKESIKKFIKNVGNNRVLDIYLKYMGIKTLTSATLIPFALIMGKNIFAKAVSDFLTQKGGFLKNKIPFLDDPLLGAYLKISGLTALTLSPNTLIPLGILMAVYEMYKRQQGNKHSSKKQSGGEFKETYLVSPPARSFINNPSILNSKSILITKQSGGGVIKYISSLFTDKQVLNLDRILPHVNNELQVAGKVEHSSGVPEPIEAIKSENVSIGDIAPETNSSVLGNGYDSLAQF